MHHWGTQTAALCYFCGVETSENAPRQRIYVPAIEQHLSGYVCAEDEPRLALRQAAARAGRPSSR